MSEVNSTAIDWSLSGNNLIEASAGTGKTYNIQTIFTRMIIETDYAVDTILVNTFTEAATKELKTRIRTILNNVLNELEQEDNGIEEERITKIIQSARKKGLTTQQIINRVNTALNNFSTASIHTLHGFCNKILNNAAFETGTLFESEFLEDDTELIEDILADFYRENFYDQDHFIHQIIEELNLTISDLKDFITEIKGERNPEFIPSFEDIEDIQPSTITEKFQSLKAKNTKLNFELEFSPEFLEENIKKNRRNKLSRTLNNFQEVLAGNVSRLIELEKDKYYNLTRKQFYKLCYKKKKEKVKKNFSSKLEAITELNNEIYELLDEYIKPFELSLKKKCYQYFQKHYKREKKNRNIKTYDDMIKDVRDKIVSKGNILTDYIREEYNAALIDEFQDTSPYQYDILRKVFIESDLPIFLVGDNKQAIYGFRGGDIYTYHKARKKLKGNTYTLNKNWRSIPDLVSAFNHLFGQKMGARPFVNDFIKYTEVKSNTNKSSQALTYNNKKETAPYKIFFYEEECNTEALSNLAVNKTVERIYTLLSDPDYKLGTDKRPIEPEDIAILVDKHSQAEKIENELRKWNIPVSTQATGNIFESREAKDMGYFLEALQNPENLTAIKTVLSRQLFDLDCAELIEYSESEEPEKQKEFEKWISLFIDLHDDWERHSFIEMFNTFIENEEIDLKKKILSRENGERRLVNFLHLAELINKEETENNREINGIVLWYNKKLDEPDTISQEEREIRLDTDRSAVQVMTIHHSKGLEFPIVFCPFLWSRTTQLKNSELPKFHDKEDNFKIALTKEDEYKNKARDEKLEEIMRLLYVAMTRAEVQCNIVWGKVTSKKKNGLNYLFNRKNIFGDKSEKGNITDQLKKINKDWNYKPDPANLSSKIELKQIGQKNFKSQKYAHPERKIQSPRDFSGNSSQKWGLASFSSIVEYETSEGFNQAKDYDESDQQLTENEEEGQLKSQYSIFDFPGGVQTGSCWHKIFEELDFGATEERIQEQVEEKLSYYNLIETDSHLRERKIKVVTSMVKRVLGQNLDSAGMKLNKIKEQNKIPEIEFGFTIPEKVEQRQFISILSNYNYDIDIQGNIDPGIFKGFVDLVFRWKERYYILDWKSNKLGEDSKAYSSEKINAEMEEKNYNLQYLLYTMAIYKYLCSRKKDFNYEENFGGVYYIFLRGVNKKQSSEGIYFDKPPLNLLEEMENILTTK